MAFLSTETLTTTITKFIENGNPNQIKHGAYELSLGRECFVSGSSTHEKRVLCKGHNVAIPPGQFAVFITEESLTMPDDCLGFISFRNKFKSRGLINVSGFHVDPGYKGRLKFSVYNAGSSVVSLQQGEPTFLIWFARLDQPTKDLYHSEPCEGLASDDMNKIREQVTSLQVLHEKVNTIGIQNKVMYGFAFSLAVSLCVMLVTKFF